MIKSYIGFINENKNELKVSEVEEIMQQIFKHIDDNKDLYEVTNEREYDNLNRPTYITYESKKTGFGYRVTGDYEKMLHYPPSVKLCIMFSTILDPYGNEEVCEDVVSFKDFLKQLREYEEDVYETATTNLLNVLINNLYTKNVDYDDELEGGFIDSSQFDLVINRFKRYLKDNKIKINSLVFFNIVEYIKANNFQGVLEEYIKIIFGDDLENIIPDILKNEPEAYFKLKETLPEIMKDFKDESLERGIKSNLWSMRTNESATPMAVTTTSKGVMHFCIGAIIIRDGKILMIDRKKYPYGWACIAGHIDEGEVPEEALIREVQEESGYDVENFELLFEEEIDNPCSRDVQTHYWYVYKADVSGQITKNEEETKDIKWVDLNSIQDLTLEPVWDYIFKKLKIIK